MRDIVIIDYGLSNLRSVKCSLEHAGAVVTRFHPEKSGDLGLKMLENLVEMC